MKIIINKKREEEVTDVDSVTLLSDIVIDATTTTNGNKNSCYHY